MSARLLALACAAALIAAPAWADDESAGVSPGGLRAAPSSNVSVGAVRVILDKDRIEVATELSARNVSALLRFDLPRFGWLGEAEPYPDRNFPELAVAIDGHPAPLPNLFSAWNKGRDISAQIRAAAIDPFAIADTPPLIDPTQGKQAEFDALITAGAVTRAPEGMLANWEAQRHIELPLSVGPHRLTVRYKARPAFALITSPAGNGGARWADVCLTQATATRLLRRHEFATATVYRYLIPVGLSGVAPASISLRIDGAQSGVMTVACAVDGKPIVDGAGEQRVRAGRDGAVHVLRVAPAG